MAGVDVDWVGVFGGSGAVRVGLPSYAFQRERFWLASGGGVGDVAAAGLSSAGHPLLGAAVGLAGGRGCVFTGRLSLESHPWLADHVVLGVVLLPGTAFVELALHAGGQVGCPVVRELMLQAPLVLEEGAGVQVQVVVGEPGESGERSVDVYSRAGGAGVMGESVGGMMGRPARRLGVTCEWCRSCDEAVDEQERESGLDGGEWGVVDARALELAGCWPPAGAQPVADRRRIRAFRGYWG